LRKACAAQHRTQNPLHERNLDFSFIVKTVELADIDFFIYQEPTALLDLQPEAQASKKSRRFKTDGSSFRRRRERQ
jgi:hypothetical protein